MPVRISRIAHMALPAVILSMTVFSPAAQAQVLSTSWIGSTGPWSNSANWSNGKPTPEVDAIMTAAGTAQVTSAGEGCRNLFLGTTGPGPTVTVTAGASLSVVHRIQIPKTQSGTMSHAGGLVIADSLVLGTTNSIGSYQISGGTLSVNYLLDGTADQGSVANFSTNIGNPTVTVAHSLSVGKGATFVSGGGTLNVGTSSADSLVVLGAWQVINRPTQNVRNFVLRPLSAMTVTILFNGITPVVSSGAAVMHGALNVFDVGAPDGTYEILRGASLTGAFDTVTLPPTGNWSWKIEGNSLYVTRGTVPVEPVTWGGIKAGLTKQ